MKNGLEVFLIKLNIQDQLRRSRTIRTNHHDKRIKVQHLNI